MIARTDLLNLHPGARIRLDSVELDVLAVARRDEKGAKCRTDVILLEPGRERYTVEQGVFLAAGKTFTVDNARCVTLYAGRARNMEVVSC